MAVGRNLTFKQFVAEQCMKSNSFDYPGERIIFFNKDCVEAWRLPDDLDPEYAAEAIVKGWLEFTPRPIPKTEYKRKPRGRELTLEQFMQEQSMKNNMFDYQGSHVIYGRAQPPFADISRRLPDDLCPDHYGTASILGLIEIDESKCGFAVDINRHIFEDYRPQDEYIAMRDYYFPPYPENWTLEEFMDRQSRKKHPFNYKARYLYAYRYIQPEDERHYRADSLWYLPVYLNMKYMMKAIELGLVRQLDSLERFGSQVPAEPRYATEEDFALKRRKYYSQNR